MFDTTLATIGQAISGERAKHHVAAISRFHRIQASPGYREAARYVLAQLEAAGLPTELLSFAANEDATFWTMQSFQEWSCASAALDLVHDGLPAERLCDFVATPTSLIQRSVSVDGVFEVVVLDNGTEAAHYQGLDVTGKLVLTDGELSRVYDLAVRRRGAAGILFDGMSQSAPGRGPLDLPDARQYTSFWWGPNDPRCFGFVLTPRQGRHLRAQTAVRVRARVEAALYDGAFEVVTALIPGRSDREVLVVAHLCHPLPSANDNASGAAAAVEVATALRRLIADGQLAAPERGIRFIWVPEMTGTYAYLSAFEDRIPRTLAGINLDMVGQDQDRCHSTFNIERPPEAMASFAPVLLEELREVMNAGGIAGGFDGSAAGPRQGRGAVRHAVVPFNGGSDHYILSDPTVGVPTPMLNQWPDRFYHTSEDTLDKVDPDTLARSSTLAAAYAYAVATAGEREAIWLAHAILSRRAQRLARLAQQTIAAALDADDPAAVAQLAANLDRAVAHRVDCDRVALDSLQRLWPQAGSLAAELAAEMDADAARERARARAVCRRQAMALGASHLPEPLPTPEEPWRRRAATLVPERRYRGPLAFRSLLEDAPEAQRDILWEQQRQAGFFRWHTARSLAEYWADGRRTVAEIADRVFQEVGQDFGPQLLAFFELLAEKGVIAMRDA